MKPAISVKPQGEQFSVVLTGSNVATKYGFKGLVLMTLHTREAAEDWIPRFRSMKASRVRKILFTHLEPYL